MKKLTCLLVALYGCIYPASAQFTTELNSEEIFQKLVVHYDPNGIAQM